MIDTKRLTQSLLGSVRAWVEPAFQTISDRLDAFDQRIAQIPAGPKGEDGKSIDPEFARIELRRLIDELPAPCDGKDADPEAVAQIVLARLPVPKDGEPGKPGKDAEPIHPDTIRLMVDEAAREIVKHIPLPKDGKDADPALMEVLVTASVATAIAAMPKAEPGQPGQNGKDADPAVIESMVDEAFISLHQELYDMTDEIMRGFEEESQTLPTPVVNLHVGSQNALAMLDKLTATFMLPVKPVYDDSGRLLYAQRVAPETAD